MKKYFFIESRSYDLLSFTIIALMLFFVSCKKKNKDKSFIKTMNETAIEKDLPITDSISISFKFKEKGAVALNLLTANLDSYALYFFSNKKDTIITKKIPRLPYGQTINGFNISAKNEFHYFIKKEASHINFEYNLPHFYLLSGKGIYNTRDLNESYRLLQNKATKVKKNDKKNLKNELDSIFNYHQNNIIQNKTPFLINLNKSLQIQTLIKIDPLNEKIDNYVMGIKNPIVSKSLSAILYLYVKNRLPSLNFKKLNTQNYSTNYINAVALGLKLYLPENKNDPNYEVAFNWFKKTILYKQNKTKINNDTKSIDTLIFAKKIKKLRILDTSFKENSFQNIIKQNPSKYYLLDFWATWCSPCITEINKMKKMTFPRDIKVITLSVDKLDIKDKWVAKSKELGLHSTFLIENSIQNKEFLKMIKLTTIPRYLIIDNNFNLVNSSYLRPSDTKFLSELNKLK